MADIVSPQPPTGLHALQEWWRSRTPDQRPRPIADGLGVPANVEVPRFIRQLRAQWPTLREALFDDLAEYRMDLESYFEPAAEAYRAWLRPMRDGFRSAVARRLKAVRDLARAALAGDSPGFDHAGTWYGQSWLQVFANVATDPRVLAPRTWGKILGHIDGECIRLVDAFADNCWSLPVGLVLDPLERGICAFSFDSEGYTDRASEENVAPEPGWEALQAAARIEWASQFQAAVHLKPLVTRARDVLCECPFYWALALDRLLTPESVQQFAQDLWYVEELRSPFNAWSGSRTRPRQILDPLCTPAIYVSIINCREPLPENTLRAGRLALAAAFLLERLDSVAARPSGTGTASGLNSQAAKANAGCAHTLRVMEWQIAGDDIVQGATIDGVSKDLSPAQAEALRDAMRDPRGVALCTRSVAAALNKKVGFNVLVTASNAGERGEAYLEEKTKDGKSAHFLMVDVNDTNGGTTPGT